MVTAERLSKITKLYKGNHAPDSMFCVMEAVAYVAGEPWSDRPACACPVLTSYAMGINDWMPDDLRTALLLPLVSQLVGTRTDEATEHARRVFITRHTTRVIVPMAFRAVGLNKWADKLAALPADVPLSVAHDLLKEARAAADADADAYAAYAATADADADAATAAAAYAAATAAHHPKSPISPAEVWRAAAAGLEQAIKVKETADVSSL